MVTGQDGMAVYFQAGEGGGKRSRGDEDVPGFENGPAGLHPVRIHHRSVTDHTATPSFAEGRRSLGELGDDPVLEPEEPLHLQFRGGPDAHWDALRVSSRYLAICRKVLVGMQPRHSRCRRTLPGGR